MASAQQTLREDANGDGNVSIADVTHVTDVLLGKKQAASLIITEITVSSQTLQMQVGSTKTLSATLSPSTAICKKAIWSSSNENVAFVNSDGKIYARANGTATITASAADNSGVKATCTVTVTTDEQPSTGDINIGTDGGGGDQQLSKDGSNTDVEFE